MSTRDLVGYGANPPVVKWPNGARIAVSVVVNYEEGSEYSVLDGDPHGETGGESPSPVGPGERDLANESFYEYGSRVGVWRLMNILDKNNVKGTFFACALALERNPEVGPEIVRRGHEVMGHGNRWEEYYKMDRSSEKEASFKSEPGLLSGGGPLSLEARDRTLGSGTSTAPISDSVESLDFVGPNLPLLPRKDGGRDCLSLRRGESVRTSNRRGMNDEH